MGLLKIKIEIMDKGKKHKIAVWVVMGLLIGGMIFLVVRNNRVSEYNDSITPYHTTETDTTTLTNE